MTLVTMLRVYDRKLKKYCREQMRSKDLSSEAVWVTDNFRLCSSALQAAVGFLSHEGEKGLWPLFFMCKEFFEMGEEPTSQRITVKFSSQRLDIFQCEALSCLLYAAAVGVICENLYSEDKTDTVIFCVKALQRLREISFEELLYDISSAERYLCEDPSGIYEKMSLETKQQYRRAVRRAAQKDGIAETDYIKDILTRARKENKHIGFYLSLNKDMSLFGALYICLEWLTAVCISFVAGLGFSGSVFASILLIFPAYALIKPVSDMIAVRIFKPYKLPSLSEEYINDSQTLVTVSALLPTAAATGEYFSRLSDIYTSDSLRGTKVMLLADLRNSRRPEEASDSVDISAVKRLIDELNEKHGGGFCVAVRDRVYSPCEEEYTGFERKRGAITALCRYLRDGNSEDFSVVYGDTKELGSMKYILALDSDTAMTFEVLRGLVAIASHPLNEPVLSEDGRIVSGYGIIAPRVETAIEDAGKTVFSAVFTKGGSVLYSPVVSERYMDMFGCSIFSGKGLINVDAFNMTAGDRLDEQRILSHDILEGSILRTAFSSDSELTDSFPRSAEAYFSRQHRWVRGDVQNLKYILCPLGKKAVSPSMPLLGKYQLFDNFRRAVTPVTAFLLLIISCFSSLPFSYIAVLTAVLSAVSGHLTAIIDSVARRGLRVISSLYFSSEITSFYKSILRAAADTGLLPQNVFVNTDAVIRSAYRCLVSRKKLLQWVPSSDSQSKKAGNILVNCIFPLVCAVLFLYFGNPLLRLFAFIVIFFIPLAVSDGMSITENKNNILSETERGVITSFAAAAWRYFEENVTSAENHLPPDNIQETPVFVKAGRTSPTNIGFYLLSVLSSADMLFISPDEMYERISATLDTLDKLPKYKGLLYNWYDIYSLKPLPPYHISSVDEGNYLVCLTALKEGLREYSGVHTGMNTLIERIEKIAEESDMSLLYDETRRLFRVGLDTVSGMPSSSYYDLYMSEARLTSYYQCAKRNVSAKHWRILDRALKRNGCYLTAASWTGTMFEYFLPPLFLGCVKNSFQYEALKSCLYFQKKRAKREKLPYGISESCFYSIDSSLNYRYKAHGIRELSLKKDADDESVISPYSVFLTLPFDKKSAMRALARLSSLHCEGKYGFYEAVDFNAERTDGEDYAIVRCYMSHHIGMSITAMANVLNDDIFVKRFMADKDMRSAEKLLEEKIPEHPSSYTSPEERSKLHKDRKAEAVISRNAPEEGKEAFAYSNGELTLFCDKYGRNTAVFSSSRLYKYTRLSEGISIAYGFEGETVPLFPSDNEDIRLRKYALSVKKASDSLTVTAAFSVHPSENALLIPVKTENTSDEEISVDLHFYFSPELLEEAKEDMHPAFSDMFLDVRENKKQRALTFFRKGEGNTPALSAGFYNKRKFIYDLDRESAVRQRTDKGIFTKPYVQYDNPVRGVSPALALSVTVSVSPGKSTESVLVIGVGADLRGAEYALAQVRSRALPVITKCASAVFLRDKLTFQAACDFIAGHFFGADNKLKRTAAASLKEGRSALWKIGLSGELPVITVFAEKNCPPIMLTAFIRLYKRLTKASVKTDIVFIFDSAPDYGCTAQGELRKIIASEDLSESISVNGGIHLFYKSVLQKESFNALIAFSHYVYPSDNSAIFLSREESPSLLRAEALYDGDSRLIKNGFVINEKNTLPWCHTLSNNTFGTLVSDSSAGFSWCGNSRQNKLTAWSNDTSLDFTGERLYLKAHEGIYDIIADSGVIFTASCAVYRCRVKGLTVTTRISVAERGARKRISVNLRNEEGKTASGVLYYCVKPVMSEKNSDARFVKITRGDGCIFAVNPMNEDYKGVLCLHSPNERAGYSDNMKELFGYDEKAALILQKFAVESAEDNIIHFDMSFGRNEASALETVRLPFKAGRPVQINADTGKRMLDEFGSALLYHQVSDTRLRARCGFYQCSGAFGFRDQLQDVCALIAYEPRKVRQMLFKAASAQFPQGDVLHWFHVMYKKRLIYKGVRTRCSDDMLWLPYAVSVYINETGDMSVLEKSIPFLEGELLSEGSNEQYREYVHSSKKATLYSHCIAALHYAYKTGVHSLPLIGTGDWNDSFDKMGSEMKGESVWLGMFIKKVYSEFAKICDYKNDKDNSELLRLRADVLTEAVEKYGWNGKWYIRAFYDDGTALGDEGASVCEIDLLCQAWASLSDMPDKERVKTALTRAYERLFDEKNGVVKLFSPPFSTKDKPTGYVNFYPEGMRENGGQYTHAAVWFLAALFKEKMTDEAERVLHAILPSSKYADGKGSVYKTEPYALAGDVYSASGHEGRGGWSLYTGSASWLLRLVSALTEEGKEKS